MEEDDELKNFYGKRPRWPGSSDADVASKQARTGNSSHGDDHAPEDGSVAHDLAAQAPPESVGEQGAAGGLNGGLADGAPGAGAGDNNATAHSPPSSAPLEEAQSPAPGGPAVDEPAADDDVGNGGAGEGEETVAGAGDDNAAAHSPASSAHRPLEEADLVEGAEGDDPADDDRDSEVGSAASSQTLAGWDKATPEQRRAARLAEEGLAAADTTPVATRMDQVFASAVSEEDTATTPVVTPMDQELAPAALEGAAADEEPAAADAKAAADALPPCTTIHRAKPATEWKALVEAQSAQGGGRICFCN